MSDGGTALPTNANLERGGIGAELTERFGQPLVNLLNAGATHGYLLVKGKFKLPDNFTTKHN
jgi:hypothetical protein